MFMIRFKENVSVDDVLKIREMRQLLIESNYYMQKQNERSKQIIEICDNWLKNKDLSFK